MAPNRAPDGGRRCPLLPLAQIVLMLLLSSMALAGPVRIQGEIRYRWEYQHHFNIKYYGKHPLKGKSNDGFLLQRARFMLGYKLNDHVYLSAGIQDSRAYDVAIPNKDFYKPRLGLKHNPYKDYIEPYNTYIQVRDIPIKGLSLKMGRQIVAFGDHRVFGPGQWGNTGRYAWDAVRLSYKFKGDFVDLLYGQNIIHDPARFTWRHRHYYQCLAIYSHFHLMGRGIKLYLEPFLVRKFDHHHNFKGEEGKKGDFASNYYGLRAYSEILPNLDLDFIFAWQDGHWANDEINAYGYHILVGYRLKQVPFEPRISTEFSYASGDKNPKDGERNTFDGIFGARDKMYGRMNLMDWKNLEDAQFNLELMPAKGLSFKAEVHKFWLTQDKDAWYFNPKVYRDKSGGLGRDLGWEFDVVGKLLLPSRNREVQFGYGHFWPGDFVKGLADDTQADWFFLQMKLRFSRSL